MHANHSISVKTDGNYNFMAKAKNLRFKLAVFGCVCVGRALMIKRGGGKARGAIHHRRRHRGSRRRRPVDGEERKREERDVEMARGREIKTRPMCVCVCLSWSVYRKETIYAKIKILPAAGISEYVIIKKQLTLL